MSIRVISALVSVCLILSGAMGCKGTTKPPTANVSGTVTVNGKPPVGATIEFFPRQGGKFQGTVGKGGAYVVTGLPVDEALVAVHNPEGKKELDLLPRFKGQFQKLVEGFKENKGAEFDLKKFMPPGVTPEERAQVEQYFDYLKKHPEALSPAPEEFTPIPPRFSNPKSSGLKVTLKEGDNPDQNFPLTDQQ
jgi:hypothetical protein